VTEPSAPSGAAARSPVAEHKADAPARVGCLVCTVSDSKTPETDTSGRLIRELLAGAGHHVVDHQLVRDEPSQVHAVIHRACAHPGVQAVILTGGTGIAARDQTFEAIDALLEKRLPGFGELFRLLSYQEIGAAAMLSRAQAGVRAGRAIFSLPGSPAACRLAVERLILPELSHIAGLLDRGRAGGRDPGS
jgi:molybdenum cofactor biosynthesis protein B